VIDDTREVKSGLLIVALQPCLVLIFLFTNSNNENASSGLPFSYLHFFSSALLLVSQARIVNGSLPIEEFAISPLGQSDERTAHYTSDP
jgi:hypothetical protein